MTAFRVYVAAPWSLKTEVERMHHLLRGFGIEPTATWPYREDERNLETLSVAAARENAGANDWDLGGSHATIVVARAGHGGEMYCEFQRALDSRIPVVWTGRLILSTRAEGVVLADHVEAAIDQVCIWRDLVRRRWEMPTQWIRDTIWNSLLEDSAIKAWNERGRAQEAEAAE